MNAPALVSSTKLHYLKHTKKQCSPSPLLHIHFRHPVSIAQMGSRTLRPTSRFVSYSGADTAGRYPSALDNPGPLHYNSVRVAINVYLCERDSGRVNVLANLTSEDASAIESSAKSTRGPSLSSVRAPTARDSDSSCGVKFDEARLAAAAVARALHSGNAAHNDSSEQQTAVVDGAPYSQKFQLQVLPTMTLRSFRLKLQKTIASRALPHLDPPPRQPEQTRNGAVGDTSSATPSILPINSTFTAHGCDDSWSSSSHPRSSAGTRLDQGPSLNTSLSPTPGRTRSSDAAKSSSTSNTSPNAHSTCNQLHQLQPRLRPRPQSQSQTQLRAWLVMGPQSADGVSELDYTGGHDTQDLAWLGVEDGSDVVVWLGS